MSRQLTEQERQVFLAEPRVGVISIASDDERPPLTVPIWYHYEPGGAITILTGTQGRKARKVRLIQKTGTVSITVQHPAPPYKYVTVEGTVVNADNPPTADQMLAIVRRYLPENYAQGFVQGELANPGPDLTLFTIRPDRWLTADFSQNGA